MPAAIQKRFGRRIRELRKARAWSQEKLCEVTGIGVQHISMIENGHKEAGLIVIGKMASAFNVSLSDLLKDV